MFGVSDGSSLVGVVVIAPRLSDGAAPLEKSLSPRAIAESFGKFRGELQEYLEHSKTSPKALETLDGRRDWRKHWELSPNVLRVSRAP